MAQVSKWSTNAGGNDQAAGPPDWPKENMDKSDVNDSAREMMAAIRIWYDDPTWVAPFERIDLTVALTRLSVTEIRLAVASNDLSGYFADRQRIRIDGDGGKVSGFVDSVTYMDPNTDVTVTIDAGGDVPTNPTKVELGASNLDRGAYFDVGSGATQLPTGGDLAASNTTNLGATTAANKLFGTGASELPQNSDLGSASLATLGSGPTQVPIVSDISAGLHEGFTKYTFLSSNVLLQAGVREPVNILKNIAFPGTPDGTLRYKVIMRLYWHIAVSGDIQQMDLHMGTAGDETDDIITPIPRHTAPIPGLKEWGGGTATGDSWWSHFDLILTPPTNGKLTLVAEADSGVSAILLAADTGHTGAQGNNQASYIYMELIDDVWGA